MDNNMHKALQMSSHYNVMQAKRVLIDYCHDRIKNVFPHLNPCSGCPLSYEGLSGELRCSVLMDKWEIKESKNDSQHYLLSWQERKKLLEENHWKFISFGFFSIWYKHKRAVAQDTLRSCSDEKFLLFTGIMLCS